MLRLLQVILTLKTVLFCALTAWLGIAVFLMWSESGFASVLQATGRAWFNLDSAGLNLTQSLVQRYLLPEVWSPGITTILQQPLLWVFLASMATTICIFILSTILRKHHSPKTR